MPLSPPSKLCLGTTFKAPCSSATGRTWRLRCVATLATGLGRDHPATTADGSAEVCSRLGSALAVPRSFGASAPLPLRTSVVVSDPPLAAGLGGSLRPHAARPLCQLLRASPPQLCRAAGAKGSVTEPVRAQFVDVVSRIRDLVRRPLSPSAFPSPNKIFRRRGAAACLNAGPSPNPFARAVRGRQVSARAVITVFDSGSRKQPAAGSAEARRARRAAAAQQQQGASPPWWEQRGSPGLLSRAAAVRAPLRLAAPAGAPRPAPPASGEPLRRQSRPLGAPVIYFLFLRLGSQDAGFVPLVADPWLEADDLAMSAGVRLHHHGQARQRTLPSPHPSAPPKAPPTNTPLSPRSRRRRSS